MWNRKWSNRKVAAPAPRMMENLEARQLMSVAPSTIVNGGPNDAVFDADAGTLHVIYYNTATKALQYQGFNDDGTKSAVTTIDSSGDTGGFLSLAKDSGGILHAAYYDIQNGDLKYARRDLAGVWSTQTVESKNTVGLYPSIALTADGQPAISYYYKNSGNLKLAKFDGAAWNISNVATANDVGRYSSLALNPTTHKLSVAFEDTTTGGYRFADESTNFTLVTVDASTKIGGGYISLAFNQDNQPAMSYYDAYNADLKYAERSSRGKWTNRTVASKNSQGLYTDLSFTFDTNQPAIVYYNKTQDSAVLAFRGTDGVWGFETQFTGGGRNMTAVDGLDTGNGAPPLYIIASKTATGDLDVRQF